MCHSCRADGESAPCDPRRSEKNARAPEKKPKCVALSASLMVARTSRGAGECECITPDPLCTEFCAQSAFAPAERATSGAREAHAKHTHRYGRTRKGVVVQRAYLLKRARNGLLRVVSTWPLGRCVTILVLLVLTHGDPLEAQGFSFLDISVQVPKPPPRVSMETSCFRCSFQRCSFTADSIRALKVHMRKHQVSRVLVVWERVSHA